jgi:hypothetical protein
MKNIENIIVILLACIVILINGQYVAEDKGGLMRYIPTYDKAGNKMGAHWWHPIYKLDQTPPPWQPWQKTSQTEFTDNRFNPEGMGIENFAHDALQTWPTPIVIGKPGHEEYPGKKYDLQGPAAGELIKPHQDVVGQAPAGQTPYPNYNLRMAAMPMHEDYMRIDPKLAQKTLDRSVPSAPPPKGTSSMGDKPDDKVKSAGNPLNEPSKMPLPSDFLEVGFYPRAPVHLASTIIARGQPVPTADLNGATHTVVHQALQGVNVGAAENPYASTQPSAVAFATNPLAYHPQAIVHHPSQIGAAAVAQTRTLQHAYGAYEGGNVAYHPTHAPAIGYQRAHTHYIRTAYAPRPGDGNYGYHPYPYAGGHPGLLASHPNYGTAPYPHHVAAAGVPLHPGHLGHYYANPVHPVHPGAPLAGHLPTGYGVHGPYMSHPGVVLPQAHPSGLVYPQKLIEISSNTFRKQTSAYNGKKPSA